MAIRISYKGFQLLKQKTYISNLSASAASVNEGSSVTFTFTTTGPNDTFYWTNSGTTSGADFSDSTNSGSFTTTSGTGSFTRTLTDDVATEGTETIIMNVRTGSYSGTIIASASVNVNDTSLAAANLFTLTDPSNTNTTYTSNNLSSNITLTSTGAYTMTALTSFTASAKMWGGAGGAYGGSGGFTNGTVGFVSGTNYVIWVGGGGRTGNINVSGSAGGFGGGGLVGRINTTSANNNRGSGGGLTGLFVTSATQANAILIAGGGGGGGGSGLQRGGNGGGTTGNNGQGNSGGADPGFGGTQSAGGKVGSSHASFPGGSTAGSALAGGLGATDTSTIYTGGGGGGGYFGGGGGGNGNNAGAAGGGGSGFVSSTLAVTGSTQRQATNGHVPQSGDVHYVSDRAAPSNSHTSGGTSGAGLFVFVPQL